MSISLTKGGTLSLSKSAPGLQSVFVGLGWDVHQQQPAKTGSAIKDMWSSMRRTVTGGHAFDLDAFAFMVNDEGIIPSKNFIVYYGNLTAQDNTVQHLGDNLTGEGEGDDETIMVSLTQVQPNIQRIVLAVIIYQAKSRGQNFGMVHNAFIRVVNKDGDAELARYNLSQNLDQETAMIFGELYREGNEWHFRAIGEGFVGGLSELRQRFQEPHTGVSLSRGANISLTQADPGLSQIAVGLGWDARVTTGDSFDLDASAFLLGDNNKVLSDNHFIFFNQATSPDGAVQHQGDNLTGEGEGDDEAIHVDLPQVESTITKVVFTVTIYSAEERQQNFGMVSNAFIRVVNRKTGAELARFDLGEDYSTETAVVFGEVYRYNSEWKFRAVGQGYAGGLAAMANTYGVSVD